MSDQVTDKLEKDSRSFHVPASVIPITPVAFWTTESFLQLNTSGGVWIDLLSKVGMDGEYFAAAQLPYTQLLNFVNET